MKLKKVYSKEFYKQLSSKEKELIYQGAIQLASGCLAFDSTIGGAPMMAGRLTVIQSLIPWFNRIATDAAIKSGLIDTNHLEIFEEETTDMTTSESADGDVELPNTPSQE